MLARSTTFRCFLALLMAVWSPVCLCQADADDSMPGHAADVGPSQNGDDESDKAQDQGDHHGGCPGDDEHKTGCDCPQLTATLAKADLNFKGSLATVVAFISWTPSDWPLSTGCCVGCERPIGAAPRPPTSLLRMHCALNV